MRKYKSVIDGNGRLVMPKVYRDAIGVTNNSAVDVTLEDDKIVVTKSEHTDVCVFCQSVKELVKFKKGYLCKKCLQKLKECND